MAGRIARALGDDPGLYEAWARALGRGDYPTVMAAAMLLLDRPTDPASRRAPGEQPDTPGARLGVYAIEPAKLEAIPLRAAHAIPGEPRLRVPVLAEAADPGGENRAPEAASLTVTLAARDLPAPETWVRPFAYVVSARDAARVPGLEAGQLALFTRGFATLEHASVYAVRAAGRVVLARLLWNGETLLVLPAPGRSDFAVLPAPGRTALAALVVGTLVRVFQPEFDLTLETRR